MEDISNGRKGRQVESTSQFAIQQPERHTDFLKQFPQSSKEHELENFTLHSETLATTSLTLYMRLELRVENNSWMIFKTVKNLEKRQDKNLST